MDAEEKRILDGIIAKNGTTWRGFLLKYSSWIYGAMKKPFERYNRGSDIAAKEDCFQEICLLLIKDDCAKLKSFSGGSKLSTWLTSVSRNFAYNFIRSESKDYKRDAYSLNEELKKDQKDNSEYPIGDETYKGSIVHRKMDEDNNYNKNIIYEKIDTESRINFLRKYWSNLDPEEQYILQSLYFDNMTHKQVGKVLDKTDAAIQMQKKRLLQELEVMFKKDLKLTKHPQE